MKLDFNEYINPKTVMQFGIGSERLGQFEQGVYCERRFGTAH
jgi:hypothetical protein